MTKVGLPLFSASPVYQRVELVGIDPDSMAGGETATATKMVVDVNDNGDANNDDEFIVMNTAWRKTSVVKAIPRDGLCRFPVNN